jgi:hypothetical protein
MKKKSLDLWQEKIILYWDGNSGVLEKETKIPNKKILKITKINIYSDQYSNTNFWFCNLFFYIDGQKNFDIISIIPTLTPFSLIIPIRNSYKFQFQFNENYFPSTNSFKIIIHIEGYLESLE